MKRLTVILLTISAVAPAQTLRDAAAQRALPFGAAADSNEYGQPNRLLIPQYASTLSSQYSMLEPENAMKWDVTEPNQGVFNFGPADNLVAFAQANNMVVRGHNLCWHQQFPGWLSSFAKSATSDQMAAALQNHINGVVAHYKGRVFAWDVVNEPFSDSSLPLPDLRDSIWYDQPGIGVSGTGYIEQALRWAHAADPDALLFVNEYGVEGPGTKFNAVYAMAKDFVSRGVPLHGIGFEMHLTEGTYPSSAGLAQNIQMLHALGLQVHITEMDVRIPVNSSGIAASSDLTSEAALYQRILTVCLQSPGCTAFQTWGFTDAYSWIPGTYAGFGAALPFDANYQPKPAVQSMLTALQTIAPVLDPAGIVNAASYQGGSVAPGELVTIFGANFGPETLVPTQLDSNGRFASNLSGVQVLFDGTPAPMIYAVAGQVSAIAPYEIADKSTTAVQYIYNGQQSNTVSVPVEPSAPGIFAANGSGAGPGAILNPDYSLNSAQNPISGDNYVTIFATGGGTVVGGATDGAPATGAGSQTLPVTATIGGINAPVIYAGPAPQEVNGVLQVSLTIPTGLGPGAQPVIISVGGVPSQSGITVAIK